MSYNRPADNVVYVREASDLSGTLDSTKLYVIDGVIDMGAQSIEVPSGGLNLHGHTFDISGLTSSEAGYTMFTSPVGGSGNLLGVDFYVTTSGAGSQVFDIQDVDATHAVEFQRVNYNSCTSLGEVDNYRQWLEEGTGRFGGTPCLTLTGAWSGGCLIVTSIVRGIDNTMTDPLFKAGTGFVMQSRFRTNMNADLGTLAPLMDFSDTNFPNSSTLQIEGALVTRNGVFDSDDTTIYPNIDAMNLSSHWADNVGLPNTHVGGELDITSEAVTTISVDGTFYDIAGTWSTSDLQHFDSPANGQLRHLGSNPNEYKLIANLLADSGANNELHIRVMRYDSSAATTAQIGSTQVRQVNNLQGGRDVAIFNFHVHVTLDTGDYLFLQVANVGATTNVTMELNSVILLEAR